MKGWHKVSTIRALVKVQDSHSVAALLIIERCCCCFLLIQRAFFFTLNVIAFVTEGVRSHNVFFLFIIFCPYSSLVAEFFKGTDGVLPHIQYCKEVLHFTCDTVHGCRCDLFPDDQTSLSVLTECLTSVLTWCILIPRAISTFPPPHHYSRLYFLHSIVFIPSRLHCNPDSSSSPSSVCLCIPGEFGPAT